MTVIRLAGNFCTPVSVNSALPGSNFFIKVRAMALTAIMILTVFFWKIISEKRLWQLYPFKTQISPRLQPTGPAWARHTGKYGSC